MNAKVTEDTLELVKKAQQTPDGALAKAWTQSGSATSGLTAYDLEAPAKKLYPVLTPLRNSIPRVSGKGGIQANWRAITGINVNKVSAGLGQGNRGGVIATSTADYSASYKGIGLDDYATFEADMAAEGFDDVRARAVEGLLRSLMIQEEMLILGGNSALALGTTPTPSLSASASGGSLATSTQSVICVALTLEGYMAASVAGGCLAQVTRTNADGSTDTYGGGSARKSSNATVSVTGPNGLVNASVAVVRGAVAYAWYWGTAGSEVLGAITTLNSVVITAAATGSQTAASMPAADYSQNALVFDGLLTQVYQVSGNSYYRSLATGTPGVGTKLTADGSGGVVEIDTALKWFWDNYRLSPDEIWVSAQQAQDISVKVLQGSANAAQRFTFMVQQDKLQGGVMVQSYLNRFSMAGAKDIPIKIHPNMPDGTILFRTTQLPYPLSNVSNVTQIRTRRDYYQIEWPLRSRKYEYGIYADEVLQNYFPPAFGVITNIAAG